MDKYSFGYPRQCTKCGKGALRVEPYYQTGRDVKLMLVGQDPTIFRDPARVKCVLMLDEANSQLSRWLKDIFKDSDFQSLTLYATNLVKCSFDRPPSTASQGGLKFLQPYFNNCKDYLIQEIICFRPNLLLTFGEPAHKMFASIFTSGDIKESMQEAFNGSFKKVKVGDIEIDYSPCLHIKTFRVAEVYGSSVKKFREGISNYFQN